MKNLFALLAFALLLCSCQQKQNYFEESAEIETTKKVMQAYEDGDFEAYRQWYADTAKIYHNSLDPMSLDTLISQDKAGVGLFSSYGIDDDADYDMVITNEGNTWVGIWGVWRGVLAANGAEFAVPVHISAKFVDGMIVEEWGYWDNHPVADALDDLMDDDEDEMAAEENTSGEKMEGNEEQ